MGNNVTAVLRLLWMDARFTFVAFWSTLIGLQIILFLLSLFFDGVVFVSGWFAVFIFATIIGAVAVRNTFSTALGLSVPRKDFYAAVLIHFVLAALALAILYIAMSDLEQFVSTLFSKGDFHFFTNPFFDVPVWLVLWLYFIAALSLMSIGHFFGSLYYRFGRAGIVAFFVIFILLMVLVELLELWRLIDRLFAFIDVHDEIMLWLMLFNMMVLGAAWLFLRKAPSRKAG